MQMIGNAGLIDIAKHWRKWRNPRLASKRCMVFGKAIGEGLNLRKK